MNLLASHPMNENANVDEGMHDHPMHTQLLDFTQISLMITKH